MEQLKQYAISYAETGWEVFPLKPDKTPRTKHGFKDATTDTAQIGKWWDTHPDSLIGHRPPKNVVILDIDIRHGGHITLSKLQEMFGEFPTTRSHASGRNDGGLHIWFQIPQETVLAPTLLEQWAEQHNVGSTVNGKHVSGVDLIHHDLRYTILPPSPHPVTNNPYWWISPPTTIVAEIPSEVLGLLTKPDMPQTPSKPVKPVTTGSDRVSPADWYTDHTSWGEVLEPAGWTLIQGDGDNDGSQWRHPQATAPWSASVTNGYLFVYSPNTLFEVTAPGDPHGYTRFNAYVLLHHSGDSGAAAKQIRADNPNVFRRRETTSDLLDGDDQLGVNKPVDTTGRWLPNMLYDSTEWLDHLRQAAESKMVNPDAVLITVLARAVALSGHTIQLPDIIGKPMGLTLYGAIAGSPGTGKSSAMGVAKMLLPSPPGFLDSLPVGSGEGMIEALYDWITEPNPETGKPEKIRRQLYHAAIFEIDEGEILADLGRRSGSTLMPTLRSAYTHSTLGQTNASTERKRYLQGETYVFGLTMGIQPEKAGDFLGDAGGGTPQRFLWIEASNPNQPLTLPEWPGPLDWNPPSHILKDKHLVKPGAGQLYARHQMSVPDAVREEIVSHHLAVQKGDLVLTEDNAHTYLVQLKTAAALALMDQQLDIEQHHWEMARAILATSNAVRTNVRKTLVYAAEQSNKAAGRRKARFDAYAEDQELTLAMNRLAATLQRSVARHATSNPECRDGCSRGCLARSIASRDRKKFGVDLIIEQVVENGALIETSKGLFEVPTT